MNVYLWDLENFNGIELTFNSREFDKWWYWILSLYDQVRDEMAKSTREVVRGKGRSECCV